MQEERVEKFWDKETLYEFLGSNVPSTLMAYYLLSIISLEGESDFLIKSKELGIIKKNNALKKICKKF